MLFYLMFFGYAFASVLVLFMHKISVFSLIGSFVNISLIIAISIEKFRKIQGKEEMASLYIGALLGIFIFSGLYPFLIESKIDKGLIWHLLFTCNIMGAYGTRNLVQAFLFRNKENLSNPSIGLSNNDATQSQQTDNESPKKYTQQPSILDTSVIIDGRIIDIVRTRFIDGIFIVPHFVLREMQLISDSEDQMKRSKGRRGLDMLNELRTQENLEIKIDYTDYSDTREVDAKLVKLAKELNAKLITNDFNLNKVAQVQDVTVLNINTLIQSLKPIVMPGEEFEIQISKEGKDPEQGVGYLEDGTMVIVENGKKLINKTVKTTVTSVIQTNAGKMIFAKI